jgi:hypothetical protein
MNARQANAGRADSACTLPRVGFWFVGHAFERGVAGFVVSLALLRVGLIRLFLVIATATARATHALRVSTDRRQAALVSTDCDAVHGGLTAAVAKLASNDGGLPC